MNLFQWASGVPREVGWRHDLRLLADPYRYLSGLMNARNTDALQLRLMGEPTLCIAGGEAVAFFYDTQRIQRQGAAPEPLRATLFGKGGVQGLDDEPHRSRKALFLDVLAPASVAALVARTRHEWLQALPRWQQRETLDLYPALQQVLAVSVCDWAGLPLGPAEAAQRTGQLVSLFDDAARGLTGHLRARRRRAAAEAWVGRAIEAVRAGSLEPPAASALAQVARHRDTAGRALPTDIAAVELLNLLRPVVAVSVYLVFVAHALDTQAGWAGRLRTAALGRQALHFVQEVRRHYPFFPMLVGRTRGPMSWRSARLPAGMRVLLDIHGTNHSRRDWIEPEAFLPERWGAFALHPPLAFVPQGGGSPRGGHRCPGEDVAVQLMLLALEMFLFHMRYDVLPRRPPLDFSRLPAQPLGGLRLHRPQAVQPLGAAALRV